ncbi:MFS transporter [Rothia dentocariosa]|uniref:MFS transporter n=1 Tax=Rothia dentocariosa TaxID=2047 RepID=UPI003A89EDD3
MSVTTPHPKRWAILGFMCLALVVTGLDSLIVAVAIPSMETGLQATGEQLQWVVAAYSLAFAAPLLFFGGLADRIGHKLSFLAGMFILLLGSILAAFSINAEVLIFSRVIMGLGSAFIMPSTLALIRDIFPDHERAKALGIWVGMSSLGIPLGPIVGGLLLKSFSWGSIFLINVPIIAVAFLACLMLAPESSKKHSSRLDFFGLILSIFGPALLVYGIIAAPEAGWTSGLTLTLLIAGVVLSLIFIVWERRSASPMLSHEVFRNRRFGGPLLTISSVFFGVFGGLFIMTQHLQFVLGLDPFISGLHMLAMCSAVLVAPISPKLVEKFGLGPVSATGPLMVALGMVLLAISPSPKSGQVVVALFTFGLGVGFGAPASVNSIIESTPKKQTGAGSAVADVAMQLGGALGIALMGSIGIATATAQSPRGVAAACWVGAAVGLLGAVAVFTVLPKTGAPAVERAVAPEPEPAAKLP